MKTDDGKEGEVMDDEENNCTGHNTHLIHRMVCLWLEIASVDISSAVRLLKEERKSINEAI